MTNKLPHTALEFEPLNVKRFMANLSRKAFFVWWRLCPYSHIHASVQATLPSGLLFQTSTMAEREPLSRTSKKHEVLSTKEHERSPSTYFERAFFVDVTDTVWKQQHQDEEEEAVNHGALLRKRRREDKLTNFLSC